MLYDTFEPWINVIEGFDFTYEPNKYELWEHGEKKQWGGAQIKIDSKMVEGNKFTLKLKGANPELNIKSILSFDTIFTTNDRIFFVTLPKSSNLDGLKEFNRLQNLIPMGEPLITREKYFFEDDEPYACYVRTKNKVVSLIGFMFGSASRKLEVSLDTALCTDLNIQRLMKVILEKLAEDQDVDGAVVGESSITRCMESKYGFKPSEEDFINSIRIINSFIEFNNDIVSREMLNFGFTSERIIKSNYKRDFLNHIIEGYVLLKD